MIIEKRFPVATRQLEYVAFFVLKIPTLEGTGHAYLACDAFSEYALYTGVELDDNPDTILKHIYLLTEDSEFTRHINKGFTLVLNDYEELSDRINAIINPVKGKLLFDKAFNNQIAEPVRNSFGRTVKK